MKKLNCNLLIKVTSRFSTPLNSKARLNMADEIIKELWQIKEDIAREHGYNIEAFVAYLQAKPRHEGQHVVDLGSLKEDTENRDPARTKKNR